VRVSALTTAAGMGGCARRKRRGEGLGVCSRFLGPLRPRLALSRTGTDLRPKRPLRRCASGRSSTDVLGLRSSALDLSPDEDKVLGLPPQLFVVQFGEEPRRRRSSARAIARAAALAAGRQPATPGPLFADPLSHVDAEPGGDVGERQQLFALWPTRTTGI
jgi:hypothetical protein